MSTTTTNRSKSEGDWICSDSKCGSMNFARRSSCNKCSKEKITPSDTKRKKQGGSMEIGKAAAEKSHGLFSADDWQCTKCCNVNWARRQTCNMCNAPKFGELEERTGYGGGFNEREGLEYIQREEDSDDEFDEFGRPKKKKFRSATNIQSEPCKKPNSVKSTAVKVVVDDDEDDEEDDEDSGDLSKYDLWGDDDDEDDKNDDSQAKGDKKERSNSPESKTNSRKCSKSPRSLSCSRSRSRSSYSRSRSRSRSHSRSTHESSRSNSRSRSPPSRKQHNRSRSPDRHGSKTKHCSQNSNSYSRSRSRSRSDSHDGGKHFSR